MSNNNKQQPLVSVNNLKVYFNHKRNSLKGRGGYLRAVDDISFDIYPGETLGLIGESGCGKTVTGKALIRLLKPTGGNMVFHGVDLCRESPKKVNEVLQRMQMIFQDPAGSLNPYKTVERAISEPLLVYKRVTGENVREKVSQLLGMVGLGSSLLTRYPAELSGGQKQRVAIARCLAMEPEFIICDESVAALDVSIRANVINYLLKLQEELGLTYLFISHDLATVRQFAHRIAIMYLGKLAEVGETTEIFGNPLHPYTRALLSAIPVPEPEKKLNRIVLTGEMPDLLNMPGGCRFSSRCYEKKRICEIEEPAFMEVRPGHLVACHSCI